MKKTYRVVIKEASEKEQEFKPSYAKIIGMAAGGGLLGAGAGAYTGGKIGAMPYGRRYLHFDDNIKSKNIYLTPKERRDALEDIANQGVSANRRGTRRGAAIGAALGALAGGYGQYKQQRDDHRQIQGGRSPESVKAERKLKSRSTALDAAYLTHILIKS